MRAFFFVTFLLSVAAGCTSQPATGDTSQDVITRSEAGSCEPSPGGVTCNIAAPRCPADTKPGISDGCWTSFCIPDYACNTNASPGTCGGPVECNIAGPECPAGTEPGVTDGCWSGFCIPSFACSAGG